MFREILLATTALLAVNTITPSEAHTVIDANANLLAASGAKLAPSLNPGKDRNSEFLCTYGGYEVYTSVSYSYYFYGSAWEHVAVPIKGHGRAVNRIIVENGTSDDHKSRGFNVGIYSNTPSGTPGGLITSATSRANQHCKRIEVPIRDTVLDDGRKYWVIESVSPPHRGRHSVTWAIDPVARDVAYSQYHKLAEGGGSSSSYHSSFTSPWTRINGRAPFVRVK